MINSKENSSEFEEKNSISINEAIKIINSNKKKIASITFIFGLFGIALSLYLPNIYRANTKILSPQQSQSSASAILNQLGSFSGGAAASFGLKNPNDMYVSILKSRAITDKIIQRFDLKNRYNSKLTDSARAQLEANTTINAGKDNLITIDVEDKDPKIAAALANAYVEELIQLTGKFAFTEASQRRVFYEKQLLVVKDKLALAETSLSKGIDANGMSSVDVQSKAVLETVSKLRAGISAKEIQLNAMQSSLTPNNTAYKRVQQEIFAMKNELSKLENGSDNNNYKSSDLNNSNLIESTRITNIQLLRDIKYFQTLYESLAKQYEIARLDESKDAPLVQILDSAVEPENKVKPKRIFIVLTFLFIGLITGAGFSFFHAQKNRI